MLKQAAYEESAGESEQIGAFGVDYQNTEELSTRQTKHIKALDVFGKQIKRKIVIEDNIDVSLLNKKTGEVEILKGAGNACFNGTTNDYHVALDALDQAYLYIAVHESGHDIAKNNSEGFEKLKSVTFRVLEANGVDVDALVKEQQTEIDENLDRAGAEEEVVCSTLPAIFRDAHMRRRFAEAMAEQEQDTRKIFEEFVDAVKDILLRAYNALKKRTGWTQLVKIENDIDGINALFDAYVEALKGRENVEESNASNSQTYSIKKLNDGKRYNVGKIKEAEFPRLFVAQGPERSSALSERVAQSNPPVNPNIRKKSETGANLNEKNAKENGEKKYSINPDFARQYDAWDKHSSNISFEIGTTSKVLQSIGEQIKR